MSEHDIATKCARQVADLQAENARLCDEIERVQQLCDEEYIGGDGTEDLAARVSNVLVEYGRKRALVQAENARLRDGLRAVAETVAGLSMTDVNLTRADMASLEARIIGILDRGAVHEDT